MPAPDPVRLAVPKAYVVLAEGWEPGPDTAKVLFEHSRAVLAPYKRIRGWSSPSCPRPSPARSAGSSCGRTAAGSGDEYREER